MNQVFSRHFCRSTESFAKEIPRNLKGKSKSSQEWLTRQLADPYVEKARMMNYRCRSAFKLLEIDQKTKLLQPGQVVLDCGASPGSWTQVAVSKTNANSVDATKPQGLVIGVDLLPIYPINGAHLIGNADFRLDKTQEKIKSILNGRRVNCVLSDMAPNATGIRNLDQENIITLCYAVLRFAILMSTEGSSLLVKVWDNSEVTKLEESTLQFYKKVRFIKPNASRSDSAEKFLLATDFVGLKESA